MSMPAALVPADADVTGRIATIPVPNGPAALALDPIARRLYATTPNTLVAIDTTTNAVLRTVTLDRGLSVSASAVAVLPGLGRVYVANAPDDSVDVFDDTSLTRLGTIAVGRYPVALAIELKGNRVFVANYGDRVNHGIYNHGSTSIIDGATNTVIASIAAPGNPTHVDFESVVNAPGRIYTAGVEAFGTSGFVQVIGSSAPFGELAMIGASVPSGLAVDGGGGKLYLSHAKSGPASMITLLDLATRYPNSFMESLSDFQAVAVNQDARQAYHRIYVADAASDSGLVRIFTNFSGGPEVFEEREIRVGRHPVALAVDGTTHRIYVADQWSNDITVLKQGQPQIPGRAPAPRRVLAGTAEQVRAGVLTDPFVTGHSSYFDPTSIGMPVFVRALRAEDPDIWLVPQHGTVFVVARGADGLGSAGMAAGFGPTDIPVPPIPEIQARAIAGVPSDPVTNADLVWMLVSPMSGFFVEEIYPMWRLTRQSGQIAYVTSAGKLVTAAEVDAVRSR